MWHHTSTPSPSKQYSSTRRRFLSLPGLCDVLHCFALVIVPPLVCGSVNECERKSMGHMYLFQHFSWHTLKSLLTPPLHLHQAECLAVRAEWRLYADPSHEWLVH